MLAGPTGDILIGELQSLEYYHQDSKLLRMLAEFQPKFHRTRWQTVDFPVKFCRKDAASRVKKLCFDLIFVKFGNFTVFMRIRILLYIERDNVFFLHMPKRKDSKRLEIEQQRNFTELFNEVFSVCTEISYLVNISRRARKWRTSRNWFCKTSNRLRDSVCILYGVYFVVTFYRWIVQIYLNWFKLPKANTERVVWKRLFYKMN